MDDRLTIRPMTRAEVELLVEWAAREGWNPGLHDSDSFWRADPEAFIAAERAGELVAGGAITTYGRRFGFMGLFIVRPELRGRGIGDVLWHARRERLLGRLDPGATIGMDGVFAMQPYYARGGFVFSHRNIRFEGVGDAAPADPGLEPLAAIPFERVALYDASCFPAPRERFLQAWIAQPDSLALAAVDHGRLRGFGVVRRCRVGCKVGPLLADDGADAERLFAGLAAFAPGEPVFLDVPEDNPAGMALAARHGMREVFGCARMYLGPRPAVSSKRIFGVTTFELG